MKNLRQGSRCPGRNSNRASSKYESRATGLRQPIPPQVGGTSTGIRREWTNQRVEKGREEKNTKVYKNYLFAFSPGITLNLASCHEEVWGVLIFPRILNVGARWSRVVTRIIITIICNTLTVARKREKFSWIPMKSIFALDMEMVSYAVEG
jgi:hypothetical protein